MRRIGILLLVLCFGAAGCAPAREVPVATAAPEPTAASTPAPTPIASITTADLAAAEVLGMAFWDELTSSEDDDLEWSWVAGDFTIRTDFDHETRETVIHINDRAAVRFDGTCELSGLTADLIGDGAEELILFLRPAMSNLVYGDLYVFSETGEELLVFSGRGPESLTPEAGRPFLTVPDGFVYPEEPIYRPGHNQFCFRADVLLLPEGNVLRITHDIEEWGSVYSYVLWKDGGFEVILQESSEPVQPQEEKLPRITVLHELTGDFDGDGAPDQVRLQADSSGMEDGFCFAPTLALVIDGEEIAALTLFEDAGYVKPYFIQTEDFDGDGVEDILIGYESRIFSTAKQYCLITARGARLIQISPKNIVSEMHRTLHREVFQNRDETKLVDMLERISGENAALLKTAGRMRVSGPYEMEDTNADGRKELRYQATILYETGKTMEMALWFQPDVAGGEQEKVGWRLVDYRILNEGMSERLSDAFHIRFVSDITDDDGVGYGFSALNYLTLEEVEEFSDWTLKDRSQSYLEWTDERNNSHGMILYPWDTYLDSSVWGNYHQYTFSKAILQLKYGNAVDAKKEHILPGMERAEVKDILDAAPCYEDESRLVYFGSDFYDGGPFYDDPMFGTSYLEINFSDDRVDSFALVGDTDYPFYYAEAEGNFGSSIERARYITLSAYPVQELRQRPNCMCWGLGATGAYPGAVYPNTFPSGSNLMLEYINSGTTKRRMHLLSEEQDTTGSSRMFAAAVPSFVEMPYRVRDYNGDGYDELLTLILTAEGPRFGLYQNALNARTVIRYLAESRGEEYSEALYRDIADLLGSKGEE